MATKICLVFQHHFSDIHGFVTLYCCCYWDVVVNAAAAAAAAAADANDND